MAGKNLDYWYDEQIKRYLIQLVRIFSNFKVRENTDKGTNYNRVPARYGDISRMVAHILRNNSENTVNSAPMITVSIGSIAVARERAQDPYLMDTQQVAEREWDRENNMYTSEQGNLYTTKRYMPVPYNLTINVDIWTTNTDTKLQLLEQIMVLFNPSIQLQSNSNPLDWSNVFEVEMTDINFSSRSLPAGVDEQLDIATLTFDVPIWISPPAKVQRQKIIQKIIADIHKVSDIDSLGITDDSYYDFFENFDETGQVVITPNDYKLQVANGGVKLITIQGQPVKWNDLIEMQGELKATSRLELNLSNDMDDISQLVIGTVVANPLDETSLIFNVDSDTLPSDTLSDITKIINPQSSRPSNGLDPQALGQRYLITENIVPTFAEWGGINASANDIIEYDGNQWSIVFDSSNVSDVAYVTNSYTNAQYKWTKATGWISSWEGEYNGGYWRLIL
jgi:hypothetical protein